MLKRFSLQDGEVDRKHRDRSGRWWSCTELGREETVADGGPEVEEGMEIGILGGWSGGGGRWEKTYPAS